MKKIKQKILVAMSGGVDSSVSAALLKKEGYEVVGIFMRLNNDYKAEEKSAKEVAKKLKISFKVADARKNFEKNVINYFLKEYKAGRTPNPCVVCNPQIKFETLIKEADKMGIKYIATGHYARLRREFPISKFQFPNKSKIKNPKLPIHRLIAAKDKTKDQSYFLYGLNQKQLARIVFPIGNYKKTEVRKLAKKLGLPSAERKESQDVCFLKNTNTKEFLRKNLRLKKSKIIDRNNNILGEHQGLALYTLGQRKGINVGGTGPYYVIGKNSKKNQLIVSNNKKDIKLFGCDAIIREVNWISDAPKLPARFLARTRYRNPLSYATINTRIDADRRFSSDKTRKEYLMKFEKSQRALTPGQSIAFYKENGEMIGGGIIK